MRAIVLVGGFGTRLRPLTLSAPKQMLPIGCVTMLERVVAKLGGFGVEEVVLSLGYQPDAFRTEFPDSMCAGVKLVYAVEPEPLDTAGAIRFAAEAAGVDERFLAVNGDVLTDLDIAGLWERHAGFGGEATIALTPVEDPSRYGVVPIDEHSRVEAFIEKPAAGTAPSNWINAGTYVLEPSVLERIPAGRKVSIERETFPGLVADRQLFAVQSDAYWIDAGTPEAYLQAHLDLLDGVRGEFAMAIHSDAKVDPDAKVSRSMVGPGAVIAAGTEIVDSVVMAGARVDVGSRIERSLIGSRASIGASSELTDLVVVGFDEDVPAGTSMRGGSLPPPESW